MKKILLIVVSVFVILGFVIYQNREQDDNKHDNAPLIQGQLQTDLSRQKVFAMLTKNSWCNRKTTQGSMFPDYTDYKFNPDGTYGWQQVSDYTPAPGGAGRWNFEQNAAGDWFLLYDNGQRQRFTLSASGTLILANFDLEACDPITISKVYDADTLPPIQLSADVISLINEFTSTRWKRANDFDLDYEPTLVEFKKNFEYTTTYRNGECQNSGDWEVMADGIGGSSLTDACDPRNDIYPESLGAKFLDNGFLFLDYDLYVPENYPLEKGVIWSVFGYSDVVNIKVEYDMPIRAGVPNKFDVEITNVGTDKSPGAVTLQRFSITEEYQRNYRQADNTLSSIDEIAGQNLNLNILHPGETYKFSFDVTFDKSGKQTMYVNGLMYGSSQDWDTHEDYSINVQ